jgi:hypothetical protein
MTKLYYVRTIAREHRGCKNVTFCWFRSEAPTRPRQYAKLIENYDPHDDFAAYSEGFIDEMFTEDEAQPLKEYLDRVHGELGPTTVEEESLPVPNNMMGYGARAVGGGDDFYMLSEEPEYSLPFKVWGYFDLVGCTLIDNGDTYRHRLFVVRQKPDGTVEVHKETNAEAAARERLCHSSECA